MAKVVLTGATGVLGRHTHRALSALGHDVTAVSRVRREGAGWTQADLRTGEGVAAAVRGAEAIVHCATHPFRTKSVDRHGLRRLREAAPQARVVYPSIVGVDAVAFPYYRQKLAIERDLAGSDHAIVRFTQFHEFPHQLAALPLPLVPAGFRTQPIAAREAAQSLAQAVEGPKGRRPDIGGPEVHHLRGLVLRVARAAGRKVPILALPMPGSAGFRRGLNLCPEQKVGRQTWEEHFQAWLQTRPLVVGGARRGARPPPADPGQRCALCGTSMLRYPRDFEDARLKGSSFPLGWSGIAGRPDFSRPVLVCPACGHNQVPKR